MGARRPPASVCAHHRYSPLNVLLCAALPSCWLMVVAADIFRASPPENPPAVTKNARSGSERQQVRQRLLLKCFMGVSTTPALLALTRQQVFELFFQGPVMKKQFKNSLAGLGYRVSDMRFAVRRFWRRWFGRFVFGFVLGSAWRFSVGLEVRWLALRFFRCGAFPAVLVLGSVGLVAALVRWLPGPWWFQFGVAVVGSLRVAWFLVRRL